MAKKHFDNYFKSVEDQYMEMKENLEELEKLCLEKVVDPDVVTNYKNTLSPIKDTYNILCHVQYLLHLPAKKTKLNKFKKASQENSGKQILEKCSSTNKELKRILSNVQ